MTFLAGTPTEPPGRVISSPGVKSAQRRQVLLVNGFAALGIPSAAAVALIWGISSIDLALLLVMWALTMGVGISVGFHRYFTHRAFEGRAWLRATLGVLGSMAGQGPLFAWVAIHRRHHEYSDVAGDPHSPQLNGTGVWKGILGLWHAHFGWFMNYDMPNPIHYAGDLIRDPVLCWISRHYLKWVFAGLLLSAILGGVITESIAGATSGFIWGGLLRLFVSAHITWSINSICHMFGKRLNHTNDHSVNNIWLAIPSFGEAWHNNHHYAPTSANFSARWWQLDPGYWTIFTFRCLRIARNVKRGLPRSPKVHLQPADAPMQQRGIYDGGRTFGNVDG